MLRGGAKWAVEKGWGERGDLERIEEGGQMSGARPETVSDRARARMRDEVGTLGSGNHYLEVQEVAEVHDAEAAEAFGLQKGDVLVSIHCGSRGLRPPDRHRGAARDARRGPEARDRPS